MKIGVYFPGFTPEAGGGYTFEQVILTSLVTLAEKSHHHFTLFFDNVTPSNMPTFGNSSNLNAVLLERPVETPQHKGFWQKVVKKLGLTKSKISPAISGTPFQNAVTRENIEFVWFPTPNFSMVDIPYIATVWDIQHRLQPWFPEVSSKGVWNSRETDYTPYFQRAAFVVTGTQEGKNEIAFFYQVPQERFKIFPFPAPQIAHLPSDNEVQNVLRKYKIPTKYLFYPAQFWPHKNHANLLLALKDLRERYKIVIPLVLVGSNQGNFEYIQNLANQLGLEEQVIFLGFIPREDLIALFRGAAALTFVTFFGPDNLPPLEAFACGCPVISSNVAGAYEQLGDAALFVDARKPEEIADAVKLLITNAELRANLIQKGQARGSQFTGLNYVEGIFTLFDEFESIRRCWRQ